jgi:hypothetical protein
MTCAGVGIIPYVMHTVPGSPSGVFVAFTVSPGCVEFQASHDIT